MSIWELDFRAVTEIPVLTSLCIKHRVQRVLKKKKKKEVYKQLKLP